MKTTLINKNTPCCLMGSYEHQVPMPIRGRRREIDFCIADIVAALNAAGIITDISCCGHGIMDAFISCEDGRELVIKNVKKSQRLQQPEAIHEDK